MKQGKKVQTHLRTMTMPDSIIEDEEEKMFGNYSMDFHTAYKPRERTLKINSKKSSSLLSIES